MRVLLINMPFAAIDSPSLALGLFKARLRQDGIPCDVQHLNFTFAEMAGYDNYEFMLRLPFILGGEQIFARALFGDLLPSNAEYYSQVSATSAGGSHIPPRLEEIRRTVQPFLQLCMEHIPWQMYDLIGFTSLFEQNLASLALACLIKRRYPGKIIVFGGANCEQIMGATLHRCFTFVDFVCSGEGDDCFPELVKRLNYGHSVRGLPGLIYRENGRTVTSPPPRMVEPLDTLPFPDYDEYFERLNGSPLKTYVRPSLLMESARGCWWGEKSHCTFCGLNGLTMHFRAKAANRTLEEITSLLGRYGPCIVRFTDNILSPKYFTELLPEIARRRLKTDYICEVKSNLKKPQIKALADAGVSVQAGIENLSTHVLDLMAKGSNSLMNVQTLKWCKQFGVLCDWNLLYGFPGEVPTDYRRNLELCRILTHLDPPTGCGPIRMDRFSPNFNRAAEKGLIGIRPFKFYKYVYPFDRKTLLDLIYYFDFDYEQQIATDGCIPDIEDAIRAWHERRHHMYAERARNGVVIRDTRPVAPWPEMIVTGLAARIYEYCDRIQSLPRIVQTMRDAGEIDSTPEHIAGVLREFVDRKLMIQEGNRYLSLAVLTYTTEYEKQEQHARDSVSNPILVQLAAAS